MASAETRKFDKIIIGFVRKQAGINAIIFSSLSICLKKLEGLSLASSFQLVF